MSLLGALAAIGLRPVGDPAGMRAYGATLHAAADQIQSAGSGASASVDRATFVGPAGDRTRRRSSLLRGRTTTAAAHVHDLANELTLRAGDVERRQHTWDGVKQRLERELREATGGSGR